MRRKLCEVTPNRFVLYIFFVCQMPLYCGSRNMKLKVQMIRKKLPHTKSRKKMCAAHRIESKKEKCEANKSLLNIYIFWHIQGIFTLHILHIEFALDVGGWEKNRKDIKFEFIETHSAKWNIASDCIICRIRPYSYLRSFLSISFFITT